MARYDRDLLTIGFGSLNPPLAQLPHCLIKAGKEALQAVLCVTKAKGGIFGDAIFWDAEERPYLGCVQQTPEDLVLWETASNQSETLKRGPHAKLSQFTAVINARTPTHLLRVMLDVASNFDYSWWIENITNWLPGLRWAYIPLTEDTIWAMIVVSRNEVELTAEMRRGLSVTAIEWCELVPGEGGATCGRG